MNHPPQDRAGRAPAPASDAPTRDVRLPPLPGRPPAEARPEWQSPGSARVQEPDATGAPASREAGSTVGRSSSVAPESLTPPAPRPQSPPAAEQAAEQAEQAAPSPGAPPRRHNPVAEKPADDLPPPREQPRQQTLAFGNPRGPDALPAPAVPGPGTPAEPASPSGPPPWGALSVGSPPSVPVTLPSERGRRWPWVVLTLLPILVIVVSGLLLLWLLRGN